MKPASSISKYTMISHAMIGVFLLAALIASGCKEPPDNADFRYLLAATTMAAPSPTIYKGFTDIPRVITSPAANASSLTTSMTNGLVVAGNSKLEKITAVFNPVREAIKGSRDIIHEIGQLVAALSDLNPGDQVIRITINDFQGQPAKAQYQSDSTHGAGGRKLEIWWDNAPAPYYSLKGLELVFINKTSGDIQGEVWARYLENNLLHTIFVDFNYFAREKTSNMSVINQDASGNHIHMFVKKENDIVSIDGSITVRNFAVPVLPGVTIDRTYVFNAAGSDESGRGAVQAALPLITSTSIDVYGIGAFESFSEIYTDWFLLVNTGTAYGQFYNMLNAVGLPACSGVFSAPSNPNPPAPEGNTATQLLTCMNAIRAVLPTAFDDIYFVPQIQNPAFFSKSGDTVTLQAVGAAPDSSFDAVTARLLGKIRSPSDADYPADFTPNAVAGIDIVNGTNIPASAKWINGNSSAPW